MGNSIYAVVIAVVLLVLALALFPTQSRAINQLYLYWVPSAEDSGGHRYDRVYVDSTLAGATTNTYNATTEVFTGSGLQLTTCTIAQSAITGTGTTTENYYDQDGNVLGTATGAAAGFPSTAITIPSCTWVVVPSILERFGSIGELILSVMPLLILVSFLGSAAVGLLAYARGATGNLSSAIGVQIFTLILFVIVLSILPTVMDQMVTAAAQTTAGNLAVTAEFNGIMELIFSALPIVLVVSTIGLAAVNVFRARSQLRSIRGAA